MRRFSGEGGIRTHSEDTESPAFCEESSESPTSAVPLNTAPNPADHGGSDDSQTNGSMLAESIDASMLLGPANVPAPLHEPPPLRPDGSVDWVRLDALVRAVDALVSANLASEARPLVSQVRAIVEAARGPSAEVIELRRAPRPSSH